MAAVTIQATSEGASEAEQQVGRFYLLQNLPEATA
jgi:hypothetical protein